ncbi:hypothetical protein KXD96_26730 [Mycobacterium sp. SMC-2]|jgi:hypothetical protein|uniref:hypothetical protein n=1 Tax=Mycobacterium TaxID=1763 RepID=UPI001CE13D79|nr:MULTISPECIES: hypothetical protein [Mycobacterium]MCA4759012.1 hypothetical protein [Mycobacterium avium subsp. hominissuis]UXA06399.1 hypothetical protein KXD96_26730 [Mycobacterium sp. SMC-2]
MGDFERIKQLGVDDWADQDLLTKDEARGRLVSEIERTRRRLDQLHSDDPANDPEIMLLARRLNAMESLCGEYDAYLDGK